MKIIIKTTSLAILLLTIISCNDLTETVYTDITEDSYVYSEDDISAVIGPVYSTMRDFFSYRGFQGLQETTTDQLVMPANASGWDDGGIYKKLHLHTWTSEAVQIKNIWHSLYKGAIHANRIIEQIENGTIPFSSEETKKTYLAEITVARAFYYWLIIDNFGDVPFVTTTAQELPAKTDRAAIYSAIVTDINNVMGDLNSENSTSIYGRFNKWGAKTLLANLYLNAKVYTGTAAWDNCLAECNDIIASGKYSLETNYADCFASDNESSAETIFAMPSDEINGSGMHINYTLHAASKAKYNLRTTPYGAGCGKAVSQFIDTYDPEDSRIDDTWEHGLQYDDDGVTPLLCTYDRAGEQLNYTKDLPNGLYTAEDEGYRIIKFKPEMGAAYNMNNDLPFFRYAQVLMMKAECLLRKGDAGAAATIVTEVRKRAFKENIEKAAVTGEQLTADSKYQYGYVENYVITNPGDQATVEYGGFYDELGYEFACEWMRRRDMIRFGTYTTKSWLSHTPQGSYTSVLPIPQSVLDANPNLEQNPDYQ